MYSSCSAEQSHPKRIAGVGLETVDSESEDSLEYTGSVCAAPGRELLQEILHNISEVERKHSHTKPFCHPPLHAHDGSNNSRQHNH
mmetsp:Transcript_124765/g.242833  ORF Transcript_124765/g.242833 Transcript_124765/m.242833 type:complete len:86 (+) Transcript_124765:120-377(+)